MRRFFNLLEAEGLLPQVERLLRSLIRSKQEYEEVDAELSQIKQRIAVLGGTVPPRDRTVQLHQRKFAKPDLFRVGRLGAPHARAGGKDLERIGAELFGFDAGALERAGGGGVNADTQVSA